MAAIYRQSQQQSNQGWQYGPSGYAYQYPQMSSSQQQQSQQYQNHVEAIQRKIEETKRNQELKSSGGQPKVQTPVVEVPKPVIDSEISKGPSEHDLLLSSRLVNAKTYLDKAKGYIYLDHTIWNLRYCYELQSKVKCTSLTSSKGKREPVESM